MNSGEVDPTAIVAQSVCGLRAQARRPGLSPRDSGSVGYSLVLMAEQSKSLADQVSEIAKLVVDVQDRLDQVTRALKTLEGRLSQGTGAARPGDQPASKTVRE